MAPYGASLPMPSRKHQRLVVLLTEFPELFVDLVRLCSGFDVPGDLELLRGPETVQLPSTERIADGVVVLRCTKGGNREAFVLEVQLDVVESKRKSWPAYIIGTAVQLDCPTALLVVTPSKAVARWAAKPIDVGRGRTTIEPLVIGPEEIPSTLTIEEARARPDWLALILMMHGHEDGTEDLNRMAMQVAHEVVARGDRRSIVLADLIVDSIREDVREMLQTQRDEETGWGKTIWFSEIGKAVADSWADGRRVGRKKGQAEGMAAGLAKGQADGLSKGRAAGLAKGRAAGLVKALLVVLESRGIGLTKAQRSKVSRCRSSKRLEQWLRRATAATSADEIFA